jgi:hypothetical protein
VVEMALTYLVQVILSISLRLAAGGPLWEIVSLAFSLTLFFINLLVLTIVLYFAGLIVVGKKRALLSDAFIVSLLGTVLSTLFLMLIPYHLVSLFLFIFVWLLLVKRFYETGWLSAIAVAILTVIIFLSVMIIVALLFGILEAIWNLLFASFVFIL